MGKRSPNQPPSIRNKKALFDYEIIDRMECGIVLKGTEVKSLRQGHASLDQAYARIAGGEVWLIGCNIKPYEKAEFFNHDPLRKRKLLLRKREILKLLPKVTQRGQTLVPLAIYFNDRGLAKVEIAVARGKTHGDKRQEIKKRDQEREMRQTVGARSGRR